MFLWPLPYLKTYLLSENPGKDSVNLYILVPVHIQYLAGVPIPPPQKKIKSYRPAGKKTSDTHLSLYESTMGYITPWDGGPLNNQPHIYLI